MYDLISIGNISFDLFFKGESLTFGNNRFQLAIGGKYFVNTLFKSVGGGGANVAIGTAKNKLKTAVLGKIGNNNFKSMIIDEIKKKDVSTDLCQYEDNYLNLSIILLNERGERSIIHYSPPHTHILKSKSDLNKILKTKALYLGNLPDVSLSERKQLLHFVKNKNIITFVNFGVADCRRPKKQLIDFFAKVDILIVNGHEFADIVKAPYKDIHFKENIIDWYIPELKDKLVIVTEGKKGSYAYLSDKVIHQPAYETNKVIDTTGAGDAYSAGFIAEYLRSYNIEKAMHQGAKYSTHIINHIGAN